MREELRIRKRGPPGQRGTRAGEESNPSVEDALLLLDVLQAVEGDGEKDDDAGEDELEVRVNAEDRESTPRIVSE